MQVDRDVIRNFKEAERRVKLLEEKYEKLGLLEGIKDRTIKANLIKLLENQKKIIKESDVVQSGIPSVSATSDRDIAPFPQYFLTLVRRVYPALFANEIVGIQPLSAPTGLVFYLKYRYEGLTEAGFAGDNSPKPKGKTQPGTQYAQFIGNTWNVDPYYSSQLVWREEVTASITHNASGDLSFSTYALKANPAIQNTIKVVFHLTSGTNFITILYNFGSGIASVISTNVPGVTLTSVTASYNSTTNEISVSLNVGVDISGYTAKADATYEYRMEGNKQLPEISFFVEAYPVTAKERVLRSKITLEAIQDLRAYHQADAEAEIINLLTNEVAAEIDREILSDLVFNASTRVDYDYSNPFLVGGTFTTPVTAAIPGAINFDDRNRALMYQVLEASNQIFRQTLRGAGNIVVTSPEVASKLESLREFKFAAPEDTPVKYSFGIQYSGTINSVAKVYKDPLFPRDLILVAFKGSGMFDSGYFYAPYIPFMLSQTVPVPGTTQHVAYLITRYGKLFVENGTRFYAVIKVKNLTAIGADRLPGSDLAQAGTVYTGNIQGSDTVDPASDLL